jgi:hypothetical protein
MDTRYVATWCSGWNQDAELPTYGEAVCRTELAAKRLARREGDHFGWASVELQERGPYGWDTRCEWRIDGTGTRWQEFSRDE